MHKKTLDINIGFFSFSFQDYVIKILAPHGLENLVKTSWNPRDLIKMLVHIPWLK